MASDQEDQKSIEISAVPQSTERQISELLAEYSNRLKERCNLLERNKNRIQLKMISSVLPALLVMSMLMVFYPRLFDGSIVRNNEVVFIFMSFLVMVAALSYYFVLTSSGYKEEKILMRDIDQLSRALDKIIERASSLHSYRKLDEMDKFLLDIRLAEAETVMRHAKFMLK